MFLIFNNIFFLYVMKLSKLKSFKFVNVDFTLYFVTSASKQGTDLIYFINIKYILFKKQIISNKR